MTLSEKKDEKSKKFIQDYIELLELQDPKTGQVDKLSKYKAIFAKSFFNVIEKSISDEDRKLYAELNKLEGDKITPVGELDYSQAKIPSSQKEYNEAYERARNAVETEFDNKKYKTTVTEQKKQSIKDSVIITSEKSLLDYFRGKNGNIGFRLAGFNNVNIVEKKVARVQSNLERGNDVAQNQAQVLNERMAILTSPKNAERIEKLGLARVVSDLSAGSNSINKRLAEQGITPAPENQPRQDKPSPSPSEPKAYCLSGIIKAIANIKTSKFAKSIFQRLRSNSGDSKGGQGR